ncbi:MAG: biotin transporter BioY, partial [Selenomonas sp.]|nr:biotin transporter BioY [Selenomonas sp.]
MIRENALDMPKAVFSVQDMTRMAICLAFCCVTAFITFPLPFTPGLVTALTIGIALTALVLPPKLAFITIAAYLFLGAVGLPVYPGGVGGLGRLMGPTAGFYFGWPIVCFLQSCFKGK